MILCDFLVIRFVRYKLCAKIYLFRSSQSLLALIFSVSNFQCRCSRAFRCSKLHAVIDYLFFQVLPNFASATHFSRCNTFFQVWPNFPCVTHFSKCDPFFKAWPIFPNVTHFSMCDPIFKVWPIFQVWPIFSSVTYVFKCDQFFQVWPIFSSVTQFSKCDPLFQVWHIFPSVTYFFYVWLIFSTVTYFANSATPFLKGATVQSVLFDLQYRNTDTGLLNRAVQNLPGQVDTLHAFVNKNSSI